METTEDKASLEKGEVEENTCTCGAEDDLWPPVRVENAGTGEFGHELVDVTFQAMASPINVARGISEASWGSWRFDDLGGYLRRFTGHTRALALRRAIGGGNRGFTDSFQRVCILRWAALRIGLASSGFRARSTNGLGLWTAPFSSRLTSTKSGGMVGHTPLPRTQTSR